MGLWGIPHVWTNSHEVSPLPCEVCQMLNHRWKRKTTQLYMYAALTLHTHTQYHTISFIFNPYSVPQLFWRHVFVAFDTCHCSSFSVILTSLVGPLSTISARIIIGLRIKRKTCVFFPASMTNSSKLSFWLSHPSTDSVTGAFFFHHFLSVHQN